MDANKNSGGNRVKQETAEVNQVWRRKSGTHFIVSWIGFAHDPIQLSTFTIETRRTQKMKLPHLLTPHKGFICVAKLSGCKCCQRYPHVRYGKVNGVLTYHVSCDCLEFDSASEDLEVAIRGWKSNMKHLNSSARGREARRGLVIKAS